jgi:hypothetical protein
MESNDVRMQQVPRGSVDSGKLSDSPPADPAPTVKNEPPVFVQHPPKISRGRVQPQPSRSSQTVIEELNRAQNGNARPAQKEEPKRPDFKSTSGFNQRPEQPTPEKPRSYNEPKRYNQRSGDAQHKKFGRGGIYVRSLANT